MYYGSRSPSSYLEGRSYNGYGKSLSYNYSSDLSLSSLTPRNPSIQRVLNSEYGRTDRSLSPSRDYSSRGTAFRPLPSVLSGDTSPTLRRRDISQTPIDRSSPVSILNDDISYSKPRNYYDFPSTSTGMFTYSSTIKKPRRTDYTDYLRPVLSSRPVLKSGYIPRSRAERDNVSTPIIRERKLIKFRETSDEVIDKIRRKISWDLPDEISSPLIDEMKQKSIDSEDIPVSEQASSRRGSKDTVSYTPGTSPISGSPRPSISRRSSGDQSIDRSMTAPIRKNSRTNSLIASSIESIREQFDYDDLSLQSKAPIPPPRKKSIGSSHKVRKSRKSSVDILLSEEKTQNYSKIAEDIRRNREIAESIKKLADESPKENRRSSEPDEAETVAATQIESDSVEKSAEVPDRSRRRRRRISIPEPETTEEQQPESRRRRRSRFSNGSISPSADSKNESNEKFEDEVPRPASRMHRKSVKYKYDALPPRRSSKNTDMLLDSVSVRKTSSATELKERKLTSDAKSESKMKSDLKEIGKVDTKILSGQKSKNESKVTLGKSKKEEHLDEAMPKSNKTTPIRKSLVTEKDSHIEKKIDKTEKLEIPRIGTETKVSTLEKRDSSLNNNIADKNLKTEKTESNARNLLDKTPKIEKLPAVKNSFSNAISKTDTKELGGKLETGNKVLVLKDSPYNNIKMTDTKETEEKIPNKKSQGEPKLIPKGLSSSKLSTTDTKESKEELPNKKSQLEPKLFLKDSSSSKLSTTDIKKLETKCVTDSDSELKNLLPKDSCNKISKTSEKASETKDVNKISEVKSKNTVLKGISTDKTLKTENKDVKTEILSDKLNKNEAKCNSKNSFSDTLPSADTSKINFEPEKSQNKILHIKSSSDDKMSTMKQANVKDLTKKSAEIENRKREEKQLNENMKINELKTSELKDLPNNNKSSEIRTLKPLPESDTVSKLKPNVPYTKEAEEIVIVCKLPKKSDLGRKKSIPSEPNVVVSIKGTELKTVDITERTESAKDTAPKVNSIIPINQPRDLKFENCDNLKGAEVCNTEAPDVNVTHTVVLKPKTPNKSKDIEDSNTLKTERDGVRLKPIPDVVKSTVGFGSKTSDDVSDVVKSTLLKTNDQTKDKKFALPNIKEISTDRSDKKILTENKEISQEKLVPISETNSKEKEKPLLKNLNLENNLSEPKEMRVVKDLPKIKKSTSSVLDNSKEVTGNTHLSNLKKSNSSILDNAKETINENSTIKPDLIQITPKKVDRVEDKSLPLINDALTDKIIDERLFVLLLINTLLILKLPIN